MYVTNPFDGSLVGKVKLSSASEVDAALAIAEKTYLNNKKGLPKHERTAILKKAAEIMKGRATELALLIASEGGKPLIDARVEVERAIDGVETCASEIANNAGLEIPMDLTPAGEGKMAFTIKEPIGPVGIFLLANVFANVPNQPWFRLNTPRQLGPTILIPLSNAIFLNSNCASTPNL